MLCRSYHDNQLPFCRIMTSKKQVLILLFHLSLSFIENSMTYSFSLLGGSEIPWTTSGNLLVFTSGLLSLSEVWAIGHFLVCAIDLGLGGKDRLPDTREGLLWINPLRHWEKELPLAVLNDSFKRFGGRPTREFRPRTKLRLWVPNNLKHYAYLCTDSQVI
jgi:hypothetical protein